jgi:hypothetical protein
MKRLVLHVDVNKTIVLRDSAAGYSLDQLVNATLCEVAWGTVGSDGRWGRLSGEFAPFQSCPLLGEDGRGVITYAKFLDEILRVRGHERNRVGTHHCLGLGNPRAKPLTRSPGMAASIELHRAGQCWPGTETALPPNA